MKLDPNKYSYLIPSLQAKETDGNELEYCNLLSTVTHVPIVAVLMLYQAHVKSTPEITAAIDLLIEFYNYSEVTPIELSEVQKKN